MKAVDKPYEDLANGIILQAVTDLRNALEALKRNPKNWKAEHEVFEIEKFFHSEWFGTLTDVDPDFILDRIKKEVA
jgi:hypothetical protein